MLTGELVTPVTAWAALGVIDGVGRWAESAGAKPCPGVVSRGIAVFFLFMIANGTVIFVGGGMRWYAVALCGMIAWSWWGRGRGREKAYSKS